MISLTDGQARKVLVNPDHISHIYHNGAVTKLEATTGKQIAVINSLSDVEEKILDWYVGQGR